MLKNIKVRYIWISIGVVFALTVGLIFAITFADSTWKMPLIIALTICFLFLTFAVQIASSKTFQYKRKNKYPKKTYTSKVSSFEEKLESLKYEKRQTNYGVSYLKIVNDNAYKVAIVKDVLKYFNQSDEEMKKATPNKALDKCKRFIGFEIFFDYDEETLRKMPDFTIQGEKIYYTALYFDKENTCFRCLNYEVPNDNFTDLYNDVLKDLELEELKEE